MIFVYKFLIFFFSNNELLNVAFCYIFFHRGELTKKNSGLRAGFRWQLHLPHRKELHMVLRRSMVGQKLAEVSMPDIGMH